MKCFCSRVRWLLLLVLGLIAAAGLGLPSPTLGVEQHARDVRLISIYNEREKTLATELLSLDVQLDEMRHQQAELKTRLQVLERDTVNTQVKLQGAERDLAASEKRLGRWLRYLYENGRPAILGVLLDASSFNDLLRRVELVGWMADYEADLMREVRGRREAVALSLARIQFLERQVREREADLRARISEALRLQVQKTAMLDGLRAESADLAGRIVALEQQWYASLTPLHSLLGQLDRVFTRELKPDRVYFAGRSMRMEVSEATINAALGRIDDGRSDLKVRVEPGGITISGEGEEATSFSLSGSLLPDQDGRAVRFQPISLTLDGLPVQPEVLQSISHEKNLFFSLGRQFPLFAVRDITTGDDRVTIALGPR